MSKSRKSLSPWLFCDRCESTMTQKEWSMHDGNCPPAGEGWIHSYIRAGTLYSTLETHTQEQPKYISERETDNMIFMAPMAMELCQVPIGDPVVIEAKQNTIVKTVWPTDGKTLLSVAMTKKAIETSRIDGPVKISKLSNRIHIADEITISYTGKFTLPKISPEFEVRIKNYNERHIFTIGNRISVPYYGKNLTFKIVDIKSTMVENSTNNDLIEEFTKIRLSDEQPKFYKSLYSTKWQIVSSIEEDKTLENAGMTIKDLGGYETLVDELRERMNIALGRWKTIRGFNVPRGILIYGTAGVGKSTIAKAVMSEYKEATIFSINSREIGATVDAESLLTEIFENSKIQTPSIIFIRDIEKLSPRKGNSNQESENRVIGILAKLMDDLRLANSKVLIIATASSRDLVNGTLRKTGRLDVEFEVSSPTPQMRNKILKKFIHKMPNNLSDENIERIAFTTHGFLASDLYDLCSDATTFAAKRYNSEKNREFESDDEMKMELEDFDNALRRANPSAMNEVIVDVPDVKFAEIGGQKGLKLKLKQAVEWPHRHPEVFARLGITPPRGLLMFGPPGCSKTMIAKALATESKLNFINVKGPELFSKWVGDSERAVREIFRKARQVAPSIIFIDEIDALGGERGSSSNSGGSNVQERVLTQLLTELDGVTALGNVTLVAATNRPDRIDKALLRPGRIDRIVYVPLPDAETRREIFDIKFNKMPIANDVNVEDLVDLSEGYSGAEVQAICYEAAMKALEESLDAEIITKEHFKAAFSIVTPRTPASLIQLYENYMINYNMNK